MPIKGECVFNNDVPNTLSDVPMLEINPEEVPEDEGPEEVPEEEEVAEEDHEYDQFIGYNEEQMREAYYSGTEPLRNFPQEFLIRMRDEEENYYDE